MSIDVQELAQGHSVAKFLNQTVLFQRSHNHHALFTFSTLKKNCKTSERNLTSIGHKRYMIEKSIIKHILRGKLQNFS